MAKHASKFRHVFGEAAKPEEQFSEIKSPLTSGEGQYVKANPKYFAVAKSGGGGPVYIRRLNETGRFPINAPLLDVHKANVIDFDFHPFINTIIATASEDAKLCVSKFPEEGLTQNITTPELVLDGHSKKVAFVTWNPCAQSIVASGSYDKSIKIWNVETNQCINSYNDLGDSIYSLEWNYNGSQLATIGKDKKLRLFDPRNYEKNCQMINEAFDSPKSSKIFYLPNYNWIGATGYSKNAKRQLKIWDCKNLNEPLFKLDIDQAASVLMPYYDNDTSILYLAGKGDGTITYYEMVNDDKILYNLSLYRTNEPQKGGGWIPKRGLNPFKCEIACFLKLTNKSVIPISFIVPRKVGNEIFQQDIFPDTYAGQPSLNANDWINGNNKDPIVMSLDPNLRNDLKFVPLQQVFSHHVSSPSANNLNNNNNNNNNSPRHSISVSQPSHKPSKSYSQLECENQELNNLVNKLKAEIDNLKNNQVQHSNSISMKDEEKNEHEHEHEHEYSNQMNSNEEPINEVVSDDNVVSNE